MKHKKPKAIAPPQALFDTMEGGEASSDASPASSAGSEPQSIAEIDSVLAGADAAAQEVVAAVAQEMAAREESAILGELAQEAEQDVQQPAGDDEADDAEQEQDQSAASQEAELAAPLSAGVSDDQDDAPPVSGMKNRTTMENVALVFLEDALARRLAVAWQVCAGVEDDWFDAAGFNSKQYAEARRIARALRLNGICRDGGVTDPLAVQYLQAVIARPLGAARPKNPAAASAKK
jgi:hypothetical protein